VLCGLIYLLSATPVKSDVEPEYIDVPVPPPPSAEEIVRDYWKDDPTMIWIIEKESQFNPNAKNPNSSASGLGQVLRGTWEAECYGDVFDIYDNLNCTRILRDRYGYSQWVVWTESISK